MAMRVVVGGGGVSTEPIGFLGISFLSWHIKGRESSGLFAVFVRDGAVNIPDNCVVSLEKLDLNFVNISRDREGEGRDALSRFCNVDRICRGFFSIDCYPFQLTEFSVNVLVIEAPQY